MSEFLNGWLAREWRDYRETMRHIGRIGWDARIGHQRQVVRRVVGHLRAAGRIP